MLYPKINKKSARIMYLVIEAPLNHLSGPNDVSEMVLGIYKTMLEKSISPGHNNYILALPVRMNWEDIMRSEETLQNALKNIPATVENHESLTAHLVEAMAPASNNPGSQSERDGRRGAIVMPIIHINNSIRAVRHYSCLEEIEREHFVMPKGYNEFREAFKKSENIFFESLENVPGTSALEHCPETAMAAWETLTSNRLLINSMRRATDNNIPTRFITAETPDGLLLAIEHQGEQIIGPHHLGPQVISDPSSPLDNSYDHADPENMISEFRLEKPADMAEFIQTACQPHIH